MNDTNLETESLPPGTMLIEGKQLMIWARLAKIEWALGYRKVPCGDKFAKATVGIIIRREDEAIFMEMMDKGRRKNK